jgi:hypothetical protein
MDTIMTVWCIYYSLMTKQPDRKDGFEIIDLPYLLKAMGIPLEECYQ